MKIMRMTIYRKLILFTAPVVCLSIGGVGYYSLLTAKKEMMNEIRSTVLRQAQDTAREINRLGRRGCTDVVTFSDLTSIRDYNNNLDFELYNEAELCRKSIETFMADFLERSSIYSGASYVDEKGMEIVRVLRRGQVESKRRNLKEEAFFEAVKGLKRGEIYSSIYLGNDSKSPPPPFAKGGRGGISYSANGDDGRLRANGESKEIGHIMGCKGMVLQYATPVFDERNEFDGIVTLDLDFDEIKSLVRNIKIGKTGYAFLADPNGNLLVAPKINDAYSPLDDPKNPASGPFGETGRDALHLMKKTFENIRTEIQGWSGVYASSDGNRLIGGASIENPRSLLVVAAPLSDFMDAINRIKLNSALVMSISILVAFLGILGLARSVSRPVKKLVDYSRAVAEGKFDQPIRSSSTDEIGVLTRSFKEMTQELKSSHKNLEDLNNDLERKIKLATWDLRAEKDKLKTVFEHMADGVIVLDQSSEVADLNPAAEAFIGIKKSALIGQQIIMAQEHEKEESSGMRNLQTICQSKFEEGVQISGKHRSEELRDVTEISLDEPKRVLRVFKSPMFDDEGHFKGYAIVLQDITKDKEMDQIKSDFVSNVSHELRTPLTSIKSFSELMIDDVDGMDADTRKRFAGIIYDEADRLTRLITEVLDLQRMQEKQMKWNIKEIDLPEMIETSVRLFSEMAKAKEIELGYEYKGGISPVSGDRDRVKQVLINLISNAIKFSNRKGEVKVKAEETPEGVLLSVSDKGIGIPIDKQDKVFERFYQVDSSATKQKGGTGLGLAISKEIVEFHGGRIWVESKPGAGATFKFIIPKTSQTPDTRPQTERRRMVREVGCLESGV